MNSENIIIRLATLSDLKEIVRIENESFYSDAFDRPQFIRLLKSNHSDFVVAEENGAVLGYAIFFFRKNSRNLRIYSIAVSQNARGRSIGSTLLNFAEDLARQKGKQLITLEVSEKNHTALSLYFKHKYIVAGRKPKYYNDLSDALKLDKKISV